MNKPEIKYYDNGQKWIEIYRNDKGEYHREDGPAYNIWNNNGQKDYEIYCINGKRHRENDPAHIGWYKNGQKQYEYYYITDKRHREDGPAVIWWNNNGQIITEQYWINNKQIDKFELRKLKLEKLNLL